MNFTILGTYFTSQLSLVVVNGGVIIGLVALLARWITSVQASDSSDLFQDLPKNYANPWMTPMHYGGWLKINLRNLGEFILHINATLLLSYIVLVFILISGDLISAIKQVWFYWLYDKNNNFSSFLPILSIQEGFNSQSDSQQYSREVDNIR